MAAPLDNQPSDHLWRLLPKRESLSLGQKVAKLCACSAPEFIPLAKGIRTVYVRRSDIQKYCSTYTLVDEVGQFVLQADAKGIMKCLQDDAAENWGHLKQQACYLANPQDNQRAYLFDHTVSTPMQYLSLEILNTALTCLRRGQSHSVLGGGVVFQKIPGGAMIKQETDQRMIDLCGRYLYRRVFLHRSPIRAIYECKLCYVSAFQPTVVYPEKIFQSLDSYTEYLRQLLQNTKVEGVPDADIQEISQRLRRTESQFHALVGGGIVTGALSKFYYTNEAIKFYSLFGQAYPLRMEFTYAKERYEIKRYYQPRSPYRSLADSRKAYISSIIREYKACAINAGLNSVSTGELEESLLSYMEGRDEVREFVLLCNDVRTEEVVVDGKILYAIPIFIYKDLRGCFDVAICARENGKYVFASEEKAWRGFEAYYLNQARKQPPLTRIPYVKASNHRAAIRFPSGAMAYFPRNNKIGHGSYTQVKWCYYHSNGERSVVALYKPVKKINPFGMKIYKYGPSLKQKSYKKVPKSPYLAATVLETFQASADKLCLLVPLAELGSLDKRVFANTSEGLRECCQILREITWGLMDLNKEKLVHCDLKPNNILLVNREGKVGAMIGDFDFLYEEGVTLKHKVCHRDYRAPEATAGNLVTSAIDRFSFGRILASLPQFNTPQGEAFSKALHDLAIRLCDADPEKRPSLQAVLSVLDSFGGK
ncbi:MAG: hypothetical protein SP1CHLAM54_11340 [Chlamydiia bacterium]|nr:hypothetical protein [Chlamydiia bacterium]MCH9616037.1 hypothetical protein [Chlamydiia bacterium]MCH9629060.1 hypothetical protein [Chlamydiia bacterium]